MTTMPFLRVVLGALLAVALLGGCARQAASDGGAVAVDADSSAVVLPTPAAAAVDVSPTPAASQTVAAALPGKSDKPGSVDYSCTTDADCAIKDVGNCCGTYPACVNVDSPTFPDRVQAECAAKGMSGICGFPVLSGCQCVDNRCQGVSDGSGAAGGRID